MLLGCFCVTTLIFICALVIRFVVKNAIEKVRTGFPRFSTNNATHGNQEDENNAQPEIVIN